MKNITVENKMIGHTKLVPGWNDEKIINISNYKRV